MPTSHPNQSRVVGRRVLVHGEAYRLSADALGVRVRSGRAWLSVGGVPLPIEVLGSRDRLARQALRPVFGQRA